jgi:uncharacterized protein with FMN-binding domain
MVNRITVGIVSTVSGVLLLFSYHTSTMGAGTTTSTPQNGGASTTTSGGSSTTTDSGAASSGGDGTFTGESVDTRWGPVQVAITVANGKITAAKAVVYPDGNQRDQQINAYALPVLAQEVVKAQGAQIDMVSGATVTSQGYIGSLQSAIDQAHL